MEPEYLAQTAEPMTDDERHQWFQERGDDAKAQGMTWLRFSVDPEHDPIMALVEGWKLRPKDDGPIRWQLSEAQTRSRIGGTEP